MIEDFDDCVPMERPNAPAHAPEPPPPPPGPPGPTPEEIAALCEAAYAQGRLDGRSDAATEQSASLSRAVEAVLEQLDGAARAASAVADEAAEATARLLLDVLAAMMPALCARHGNADVTALVRAVVPALIRAPAVTIRVGPHASEALTAELARLAPDWHERIRVVATDALMPGDVRIDWEGGSATRGVAELWDQVIARLAPLGLLDPSAARAFAPEAAHV